MPTPASVQLLSLSGKPGSLPRPPFGLARFSEEAGGALCVLLELPKEGLARDAADVSTIAAQVPDPGTLGDATLVVILGDARGPDGFLGRMLGAAKRVPRATRATALLARGYVNIGAGTDEASGQDLAWGYAAPVTRSAKSC